MSIVLENQAYAEASSSGTSISKTFGWTATSGRLLVAACGGKGVTGSSISLPSGWTQVEERASGSACTLLCYKVSDGTETALTVTTPTTSGRALAILEFSGCDSSPLDQVGDMSSGATTSHTVTATGANTVADAVVVACWASGSYGSATVSGATVDQNAVGSFAYMLVAAHKIVSSIETSSLTVDTGGYSIAAVGAIGTFKASGGAPADRTQSRMIAASIAAVGRATNW